MTYDLVPGCEYPEIIRELFDEYFAMIQAGDSNFTQYLVMQNADEEIMHLEGKYGAPYGRLYLLRCEGKNAGCAALRRLDDERAELKRMYVRPEYRGNGFGGILVDKLISDARLIGYKSIVLDTLPFLQSAVRLYRRHGFREMEAYNDSPMNGSIYMRLELD